QVAHRDAGIAITGDGVQLDVVAAAAGSGVEEDSGQAVVLDIVGEETVAGPGRRQRGSDARTGRFPFRACSLARGDTALHEARADHAFARIAQYRPLVVHAAEAVGDDRGRRARDI